MTNDEAVELLAKHNNNLDRKGSSNEYVLKAIESCQGLPLAVKIISGLQIQLEKQWQQLTAFIGYHPGKDPLTTSNFPLHRLFHYILQQLDIDECYRFRLLGVFKKTPIPIDSIQSLWKCSRTEATSLLIMFHQRSLLRYSWRQMRLRQY